MRFIAYKYEDELGTPVEVAQTGCGLVRKVVLVVVGSWLGSTTFFGSKSVRSGSGLVFFIYTVLLAIDLSAAGSKIEF